MKKLFTLLIVALVLSACSTATRYDLHRQQFVDGMVIRDYFLGGADSYCFSHYTKDKEQFDSTIEKAEASFETSLTDRHWIPIRSSKNHSCGTSGMRYYYQISARWKLKDGREFMIDRLNVRPLMREFFKTQDAPMQWVVGGRAKGIGDGEPGVLLDVQGDSIVLYWVNHLNDQPFAERLIPDAQYPKGRYIAKLRKEYYTAATVKGTPTSGIDFNKTYERFKQ